MSTEVIKVEQLESGLTAAFVSLPHFRTHAARLTVNAGSVHEPAGAYGSAHFLEHVAFQGTEAMPTESEVHDYAEERGLTQNAVTNQTYTSYMADGYELESVGFLVNQLALSPLIADEALEGERKPIIDELRGYASNPLFRPQAEHRRAIRGDLYARNIGGTVEDVEGLSLDDLKTFHDTNYHLGNAVLVICASESVEQQREFAESLTGGSKLGQNQGDTTGAAELGPFNPENLTASLQQVELPLTAQTSVTITYDVPETSSPREQLSYNAIGMMLSKVAHNRLRREMALCYGAGVSVARISDIRSGSSERNWSQLSAYASLDGADSVTGLEALWDDVMRKPIPETVFDAIGIGFDRDVDHLMQSNPSEIASRVRDILTFSRRSEIALDEVKDFAATVSLDTLRKLHKDLADTRPLVAVTSPDPAVLETVGDWAAAKIV